MKEKIITAVTALAALAASGSSASAHSINQARNALQDRGYYDIVLERSSLPYSFNACKGGSRFHIHMDYYGALIDVDRIGRCYGYGRRYRDQDYEDRYSYRRYDY